MAVPKISSPHIPLTLPFSKKEVVIRHLLLREYKAFLSSANSQHLGTLTKTVLDVIKSCVIEPENFSLKSIPSFEAEYLFLNIYGASVPDGLSVSYRCVRPVMKPEFIEDEYGHVHPTGEEVEQECGFKTDLNISLKDVELTTIPEQVVQLNNEIVLKLKFPSMEDYYALAKISDKGKVIEKLIESDNLKASGKKGGVNGMFTDSDYVVMTPLFKTDDWKGKQKLFSLTAREYFDIGFPRGMSKHKVQNISQDSCITSLYDRGLKEVALCKIG